jgi:H+/Cl- antiporter ClcA
MLEVIRKEVITVPTEMLTKHEERVAPAVSPTAAPPEEDELRAAAHLQVKRVRRLKIHVAAWLLGSILITTLWVLDQWQANGAFQHFGSHQGNRGDWNPTLWALAVAGWGLIVGIKALRVHFERPVSDADLDRAAQFRLHGTATVAPSGAEYRRYARTRLERARQLRFHVAAWMLGTIVLTPLWALIEWQDNGGFERWSGKSQPGDWEPWILYVGGVWGLVVAVVALRLHFDRPTREAEIKHKVLRLRLHR